MTVVSGLTGAADTVAGSEGADDRELVLYEIDEGVLALTVSVRFL